MILKKRRPSCFRSGPGKTFKRCSALVLLGQTRFQKSESVIVDARVCALGPCALGAGLVTGAARSGRAVFRGSHTDAAFIARRAELARAHFCGWFWPENPRFYRSCHKFSSVGFYHQLSAIIAHPHAVSIPSCASLVNNGQKLFPELVEGQLLAINAPLRLREVYPELIEGLRSGDKKHIIHQARCAAGATKEKAARYERGFLRLRRKLNHATQDKIKKNAAPRSPGITKKEKQRAA